MSSPNIQQQAGYTGSQIARVSFTMPNIIDEGGKMQDILPNSFVKILVHRSIGIALANDGLRRNDQRLKISCNSIDGPVLPVNIRQSPNIGYFSQKGLRFFSPYGIIAGELIALEVIFTSISELREGETVIIRLPGFTRTPGWTESISHNNDHIPC